MRYLISAFTRLPRIHRNLSVAGAVAIGATVAVPVLMSAPAEAETRAATVRPVAWNAQFFGHTHEDEEAALLGAAAQQAGVQATARVQTERDRVVREAEQARMAEETERARIARESEQARIARESAALPVVRESAPVKKAYPANLDGWIREALDVMQAKSIPGSYEGIHRNIMRESGGDPRAINLWDSNAAAGIPSKGLLQVIDPTFQAYHVDGTSWDIYDPVANITAACNYAAARYGSMDNVNSAY